MLHPVRKFYSLFQPMLDAIVGVIDAFFGLPIIKQLCEWAEMASWRDAALLVVRSPLHTLGWMPPRLAHDNTTPMRAWRLRAVFVCSIWVCRGLQPRRTTTRNVTQTTSVTAVYASATPKNVSQRRTTARIAQTSVSAIAMRAPTGNAERARVFLWDWSGIERFDRNAGRAFTSDPWTGAPVLSACYEEMRRL